jgi:hypothetical protein
MLICFVYGGYFVYHLCSLQVSYARDALGNARSSSGVCLHCPILTRTGICRQTSAKLCNAKFQLSLFSRPWVVDWGRTDEQTDTAQIESHFSPALCCERGSCVYVLAPSCICSQWTRDKFLLMKVSNLVTTCPTFFSTHFPIDTIDFRIYSVFISVDPFPVRNFSICFARMIRNVL